MTMSSDDLLPNTSDHHHQPVDVNDPPPLPYNHQDSPPPLSAPAPGDTDGLSALDPDDVPLAQHHDDTHDPTTTTTDNTTTGMKRPLEEHHHDHHLHDGEKVKKIKKVKKFKKKRSHDSATPPRAPIPSMSNSPSWNDMFFALMAFKAKLGHWNVPSQTKLGKWVSKQRQEYSKIQRNKVQVWQCAELSEERMEVLDSLGFIWDMNQHEMDRRWHERFEELRKYKDENGHCNVPQRTALGQWVKIQRENKREADLKESGQLPDRAKQKPCLAPDRIAKLDSIGFQWRVAGPVTGWENRYKQLVEYAKEHNGDVNVPQYYPPDKSFGRWVMKQRCEYSLKIRGLKSQLTEERVNKLNAIGFSWVAPNFKRKVGVGIAPGSAAAQLAAQQQPSMPAMQQQPQPVMDTHNLLPPAADGTTTNAQPMPHQQVQQIMPAPPQQQQQQPMVAPMGGDPSQQQHYAPPPYDPHHAPQPTMVAHQEYAPQQVHPMDPSQQYPQQHDMHHAMPPDGSQQQQVPQNPLQHNTVEEVVTMEFL